MVNLNFINTGLGPSVRAFSSTDSQELFQTNLKIQPADWVYHDCTITYSLNSYGYRAPEFHLVDWSNSIVIFGCSNVVGIGLPENDTVSSQLQRLTGRPVINMGASSSSMEFSVYNSGILRANYPPPYAVVHIWTVYDRCTEFIKNGQVKHHGANFSTVADGNYFTVINQTETNQSTRAQYLKTMAEGMWKNTGTQYFDCSFFWATADLLKCPSIEQIDHARDLRLVSGQVRGHPGKETAGRASEIIAQALRN